jgi:hypothetical protein
MHRPHRHLDREGHEHREEHQHLGRERERQAVVVEDLEAAVALHVQVDEGRQHQQRTHQRVEEELDRGVHAVGPAPDPDDEEHRDQHRLEEDVEQDRVERAEDAVDEPRLDQEGTQVLADLVGDHFPMRHDHQHGHEAVQEDQRHRDAVGAQVVVHVEACDPGRVLDELHRRDRLELRPERDAHQEARDRAHEREPPGGRRLGIVAHGEDRHAEGDGHPDGEREEVRRHRCCCVCGR